MDTEVTIQQINHIAAEISHAALRIHSTFGSGLFESVYRADLVVGRAVIVEVKSVAELALVHSKELLTYPCACSTTGLDSSSISAPFT